MRAHTRLLAQAFGCAIALAIISLPARAGEDFSSQLLSIQQAWDKATYESADVEAKRKSLQMLDERVESFVHQYPTRAEALVWQGIVLSSYAGAKGGLGALSVAKRARDCLLAAVRLDGSVLRGSAYTSLGALYYKVPGFPLGFGNHETAEDYLRKALALNPDGIDPNFFYGEFLFEEGKYAQSLAYLEKALAAPARPDRPLGDSGRRKEVDALLARVRTKLPHTAVRAAAVD
jgi:tetratricopeptide (TPR) repeat protein